MGLLADTELHVDLSAIVANWRWLSHRHGSGPVAGVVKANAYGLGAALVAAALRDAGCRYFFVATATEAITLRETLPDVVIAALNGLPDGAIAAFIAHDITPVLGSLYEITLWGANGKALGRRLPAFLHVDTGMHRLGLTPSEVALLRAEPWRLDGVAPLMVMTHLVASEIADDPHNALQRDAVRALDGWLPEIGRSVVNSSGTAIDEPWFGGLARPGAALYGLNPIPGARNPMRPVVTLRARVLAVRDVPAGRGVGYNATWRAGRDTRVATVGIGYADGLHRALSNRGRAFYQGAALPLIGRVSMDLTTFDASARPDLAPGDWVELLGPRQSADDLAELCGTIGYEVLTSLGARIPRIYRMP
jgi:alanine racemase